MLSKTIPNLNNMRIGRNSFRKIEFAFNNTVSKSTKDKPNRLVFGVAQTGVEVDELSEFIGNPATCDSEGSPLLKIRFIALNPVGRLAESGGTGD